MTSKDVFKLLPLGQKLTVHRECIKGDDWLKKGYSYTEQCKVHKAARRVKRINNEPSSFKEAIIEVISPVKGYSDLTSVYLDKCKVEPLENGFKVTQQKNHNFNLSIWVETYTLLD